MIKVVTVTSSNEPTSPYLQLALYVTYFLTYLNSALSAIIFLNGNKKCKVFVLQKIIQLSISPVTIPPLGQTPDQDFDIEKLTTLEQMLSTKFLFREKKSTG